MKKSCVAGRAKEEGGRTQFTTGSTVKGTKGEGGRGG